MSTTVRTALIYARLSVTNEQSVSIARQEEACRRFAELRGWEVAGVVADDGVSATSSKPEQRTGWRAVLESSQAYDVVIVWKIDRLARRVLDFLHADEALQKRNAAVVSATESIDMTTAQGRAFATMLAVFAQMEAENTSVRVSAARDFLLRNGRMVGGTVLYGYRRTNNPNGAGYVLAKDPETIGYVEQMTQRALSGETVYGIKRWLDETNAPLPTRSQKNRKREGWNYSTVERILRSPTLAGMTAWNPGNRSKVRGDDVVRDGRGLPIVDQALAVISTEQRRQLIHILDNRSTPQARPRSSKGVTPALLSGLVRCGHCHRTMHRGTNQGLAKLSCPGCHQTVALGQLTNVIVQRLLEERGTYFRYTEAFDQTADADRRQRVADIEGAITDVVARIRITRGDDRAKYLEQHDALQELLDKTQREAPTVRIPATLDLVHREWKYASDDETRRAILASQAKAITVVRGRGGRYLDPKRVVIHWRQDDGYTQLMFRGKPVRLYGHEEDVHEEDMHEDRL